MILIEVVQESIVTGHWEAMLGVGVQDPTGTDLPTWVRPCCADVVEEAATVGFERLVPIGIGVEGISK